MTFHIVANFDQETKWLGAPPLTPRAQRTISAYASLLAALARREDVTVWTSTAVDPERLLHFEGWQPPIMRVGTPPHIDLAWADAGAKAVNDRRFALQVAQSWSGALPGARVIHSVTELERHLATGGACASPNLAWVCKAPWSSAGRERAYGTGTELTPDLTTQLERLFAYTEGVVVFEPWLPRICDAGICGVVADQVTLEEPHGLMSSPRGGFAGIDVFATQLEPPEREALVACAAHVGDELARAGYQGPFGIDAFAYRDGTTRRLQPLSEINGRYTFGHVARCLAKRLGIAKLHFASSPPPGARVLIRPSRGDAACVWATDV